MSSQEVCDIERLVATFAKGFGEVKLGRLTDDEINTLTRRLIPNSTFDTRKKRLDAILAAKRRHALETKRTTKMVLESVVEFNNPVPSRSCVSAFAPETASLKVVAFNSLGLRFVQQEARMLNGFKSLTTRFADADVIMLSEVVPMSVGTRIDALRTGMSTDSGEQWTFSVSTPARGGLSDGKIECHAVLVKAPLRVSDARTQLSAEGCKLDYSPYTVAISGHSLEYAGKPVDVLLTSVHMPPAARHGARDRQLKALLSAYECLSEMRMNKPFSIIAAKEQKAPPCVHALMGDFNRHPSEMASQSWTTLLPKSTKTSSGGKPLDNIVLNADAMQMLNVRWDILALAQYAKPGILGLSDHSPVHLELKVL